jgi:hypothetical protein
MRAIAAGVLPVKAEAQLRRLVSVLCPTSQRGSSRMAIAAFSAGGDGGRRAPNI